MSNNYTSSPTANPTLTEARFPLLFMAKPCTTTSQTSQPAGKSQLNSPDACCLLWPDKPPFVQHNL